MNKIKKKSLSQTQRSHLKRIITDFSRGISSKYVKGALEHEGNLFDKACHQFMNDEIIDLFTYLHTHLEHVERVKVLLQRAIKKYVGLAKDCDALKAYNLLTVGREDGRAEPHKE